MSAAEQSNGLFCSRNGADGETRALAESLERAVAEWTRERAPVGIFITDRELRVRCWNTWMERHTGLNRPEVAGRPLFELYPELVTRRLDRFYQAALEGRPVVLAYGLHRYLISMPSEGSAESERMAQSCEIHPLRAGDEQVIGTLTRIADVTDRVRREAELQATIRKLNQALKQVKTLKGLLPICSSCKKIRDDQGYWNQIESYITEHSGTQFSHGICPDCVKKLYPEYYDKMFPGDPEQRKGEDEP